MKLRIKGNSLRLRVSKSDLATLLSSGRIEERIQFAAAPEASLVYALESTESTEEIQVFYQPQRVTVMLSSTAAQHWAATNEVGIYGSASVGEQSLELIVEKDFACLDGVDPLDADAFPNPNAESAC